MGRMRRSGRTEETMFENTMPIDDLAQLQRERLGRLAGERAARRATRLPTRTRSTITAVEALAVLAGTVAMGLLAIFIQGFSSAVLIR